MTWEELTKVPFHFVSHINMADCHQSTYASKDGRLGFADIQPMKDDWPVGKGRRYWRIGGTWYKSKRKFLEALKDFELWHKKKNSLRFGNPYRPKYME